MAAIRQAGALKRAGLLVVLSLLLASCAGTENRHTDPENDPWEGFNRKVHSFNMGLDLSLIHI